MKDLKTHILYILIFFSLTGLSQEEKDPPLFGPVYALNGGTHVNPEIGYGITFETRYHKGKTSVLGDRYVMTYLDVSIELQYTDMLTIAPKISNKYFFQLWDTEANDLGTQFGLDYIVYNDFSKTDHVLRPSIGVNYLYGIFQLSYGYSFHLNEPVLPVNTPNIQLIVKPYIFLQTMRRAYKNK
jgi:hypothetical protein